VCCRTSVAVSVCPSERQIICFEPVSLSNGVWCGARMEGWLLGDPGRHHRRPIREHGASLPRGTKMQFLGASEAARIDLREPLD